MLNLPRIRSNPNHVKSISPQVMLKQHMMQLVKVIINQTCHSPCRINTFPAIFKPRFAEFILQISTFAHNTNLSQTYLQILQGDHGLSHHIPNTQQLLSFISSKGLHWYRYNNTEEVRALKQKQLLLKLEKDRNSENRNINLYFWSIYTLPDTATMHLNALCRTTWRLDKPSFEQFFVCQGGVLVQTGIALRLVLTILPKEKKINIQRESGHIQHKALFSNIL